MIDHVPMKIKRDPCCGEQPVREIYNSCFHEANFRLRCRQCFVVVSAPIEQEAYRLANAWNCLANGRKA